MAKGEVIRLFPTPVEEDQKKKPKPKGQRKDGLVQVSKDFGRLPNGRRNIKVFYGKTLKEAKDKRDAYIRDREEGLIHEDQDITVSEWVDKWKSLYKANLGYSNNQNYDSHIKRLKACAINEKVTLGDMRMRDVREAHLYKALYETEGMSTSTIRKYNMILRQIFGKARRNKIIRDDPSEDLTLPEGTAETHRALEAWETDCILANYHEHRTGLWIMIMMLAGLRSGELYALKWESVDLKNRELTVQEAAERKGNKIEDKDDTKTPAGMRVLPICDPLYEAFERIPEASRKGYVALASKGGPLPELMDSTPLVYTEPTRREPHEHEQTQRPTTTPV